MTSCPQCSRPVPEGALYCYFDGRSLVGAAGPAAPGRFSLPFALPSGRACASFDALARACLDDWETAVRLLADGSLSDFLHQIGRPDLANEARAAALAPDADAALDEMLRGWPGCDLPPAALRIEPSRLDLGRLVVGQSGDCFLRLRNAGAGLLHGTASCDVPWLAVGDGPGGSSRHFSIYGKGTIPIRIVGKALRASTRPLVGRIAVVCNGGREVVEVNAQVPPLPFPQGVLAGAETPRQIAERAKARPHEAAPLFESGAVAAWYAANGMSYPVEGEPASGVAAVQQFFEALGLSAPPRIVLGETVLALVGRQGAAIEHTLTLTTAEHRPIFAHASSDQPWLAVRGVRLDGGNAHIDLSIAAVPERPGQTLQAKLTVQGNGRQQFDVPVSLRVEATSAAIPDGIAPTTPPVWSPLPDKPSPRLISAATPTPSSRRVWLLAVPLGLLALLAVAGTLVAVAVSRPVERPVVSVQAPPVLPTPPPSKEPEETPPEDIPPRPPVRPVRPALVIRPNSVGSSPILLPQLETARGRTGLLYRHDRQYGRASRRGQGENLGHLQSSRQWPTDADLARRSGRLQRQGRHLHHQANRPDAAISMRCTPP